MSVTPIFTPFKEFRDVEDSLLMNLLLYMVEPESTSLQEIKDLAVEADKKSLGLLTNRTKWKQAIVQLIVAIDVIRSTEQWPEARHAEWLEEFAEYVKHREIPKSFKTFEIFRDPNPSVVMRVPYMQFLRKYKIALE